MKPTNKGIVLIFMFVSYLGVAQDMPIALFFKNSLKKSDSIKIPYNEVNAQDTIKVEIKEPELSAHFERELSPDVGTDINTNTFTKAVDYVEPKSNTDDGTNIDNNVDNDIGSQILGYTGKPEDKPVSGFIGTGAGASNADYTPFWVRANQYGVVPKSGTYSSTHIDIHSKYKSDQKADVSFGLSAWLNSSINETEILIQEAYVAAKWRAWEIFAGRKKQVFGLTDSLISSGSYAWSGNALPLTKVEIGTRGFYYPKLLGGLLAVNMSYGHGFFSNDRVDVNDFYLHQKQLYFKIGGKSSPVRLVFGVNHQVQWGGTLQFQDTINNSGVNGKVASDFISYFRAVTASNAGDVALYGINDGGNRIGNHLGTIDVGLEIESNALKMMAYRQSIYEDGSLFRFENITDGLHGLSFQFKNGNILKRWVIEYFSSKDQGGINQKKGGDYDNYFNNEVYRQGWSNHQTSIGTPFITFYGETDLGNDPGRMPYFDNNRVNAYYTALYMKFNSWELVFKGSMAYAYSSYDNPFPIPIQQISLGLSVKAPVRLFGVMGIVQTHAGYDTSGWFNTPNLGGVLSLALPIF